MKREGTAEAALEKLQRLYSAFKFIEQRLTQTKTRFKTYADSGLLCGKDGLPHLVTSGDPAHAPFTRSIRKGIESDANGHPRSDRPRVHLVDRGLRPVGRSRARRASPRRI